MEQLVANSIKAIEQLEQLIIKECKKTDADAGEFLTSLAFCLTVLKGNPRLAREEGEQLSIAIERYRGAVTRAITNNDIKRVVTQTRLVALLEQANHKLVAVIQPSVATTGGQFASFQAQLAPERVAREWWSTSFPTCPLQVTWDLFLSNFTSYLGALTPQQVLFPSDIAFLRYLLDCNSTSYVGIWKYTELVRLFGQPPQLLGKLRELSVSKWFHGFSSSSEAEKMLSLSTPGTFLLRFSKAKASAVAIAFKESTNVYKHTVITTNAGKYVIDGHKYRSLAHLVLAYAHLLSTPLDHSLLRDASFFGDISGSEAQELMTGRRLGEYLWRFSSRAHFLSLTFVASDNPPQVRHVLVEEVPGGFRVETDSLCHLTLAAVVAALPSLPLRTPILHSIWTATSHSTHTSNPNYAPLLLISPLPSPFRNLTDHRAGSYFDTEENGGSQPFAPALLKRAPSPMEPDTTRRISPRPVGSSDGKHSNTLTPSVVPMLRTAQAIAKPPTPSPPSPTKPLESSGRTVTGRNKDGYSFMPPVTAPPSAAGVAILKQEQPRKDNESPNKVRLEISSAGASRKSGEGGDLWRLRPVQHPHPEPPGWEQMPSLHSDSLSPPDIYGVPPGSSGLSVPLSASISAPTPSIAVPGAFNGTTTQMPPGNSTHPQLPSSASSDSGSLSGGSGGGSPSPLAARWAGAAPRKETSFRTTPTKAPMSPTGFANSPPRLVLPTRGLSNDVQWVPMPPLSEPKSSQNRAPAGSIGAWRAIKPSASIALPTGSSQTDVAAAKATFASPAANASFPSRMTPAPAVPASGSDSLGAVPKTESEGSKQVPL